MGEPQAGEYPPDAAELVIALVAAVGTDVGMVSDEIKVALRSYEYDVHPLRLSHYLQEVTPEAFSEHTDEWLWDAMTAGDDLRSRWDRSDALALHAISDIVATRDQMEADATGGSARLAFVLRSLKTPDELETLRAVTARGSS